MVVLTPRNPNGRIVVFNPRATAAEFTVHLRFGTVTTDTGGQAVVRMADDTAPQPAIHENASAWITPYPTKFILNPGASQVVRLTATPPRTVAIGEYWSRVVVRARELVPPLSPRNITDSSVRIGLSLETSTVIPLFYRVGDLSTGVTIDSLSATRDRDTLAIRATLTRTGTAAYLGVAQLTVNDSIGRPIATASKRLAIYHTNHPRWTIAIPNSTRAQPHHVTLVLTTNRPDTPKGTIIRASAVARTQTIPSS